MNHSIFGGGVPDTVLNPFVLLALLCGTAALLFAPRRYALGAFLPLVFLVPQGQVIVLGGSHFTVQRILSTAGLIRIGLNVSSTSREAFPRKLLLIDKIFIAWALCRALMFMLLWAAQDAVINQFGFLIDAIGGYFVLRWLIAGEEDLLRAVRILAGVSVVLASCMVYEHVTMTNLFGLLGGVRVTPEVREGKIRCQAAFQHSIVAGVFGATLLPLFLYLGYRGSPRLLGWIGVVSGSVITLMSESSTPALGAAAGALGLCLWPLRPSMRILRTSLVAAIAGLALVMKAPVWFIIAHIDVVGSSSGYHRAVLVDQFLRNFSCWWLMGVKDTSAWGYDLWDVQNQFVAEGESGGLLTLIFFTWLVVRCYQIVGLARRQVRETRPREELIWVLGVVLFAHCTAFFGANYFDQVKFWWYASIAMIAAVEGTVAREAAEVGTSEEPTDFNYSTRVEYSP